MSIESVKATKILVDARGPFVALRIKSTLFGVRSVAISMSDLNGERLFKLLGRHGVPLVSAEARRQIAIRLQGHISRLLERSKSRPLSEAGVQFVETPLS